ncbi:ring-cleaving dioxygenase [Chitinophaga pinensis]|uniref:Glyoxalase/bleomycin resistance protein/dioxygenase n=1 Tax=Chitinophaga pinensis (strain ATCC 43595 / DSM 2588 / LMG 13176 / NBRC 15968 / NCIMB 11800 / UQM 2034) TaxID=485918 RepID=A0A979GTY7_CHIPD|nr:ring-cleaving dioxygenase [Chitinophaga pinensis]ACU62448.1 Glyoxalase/bleomycin resistance protein/dioxygenase [Chitinophaga pinensis DSM 2588]
MEDRILGLHHITAIADNAKRNLQFYTDTLGVRFVKKTVNFDDPGTYHFYFGDEHGTPGTILTFFPWEGIGRGNTGTGMATEIGYSVPAGSLDFWADRFAAKNVVHGPVAERFGELYLPFEDPDGLKLNLIVPKNADNRTGWETAEVKAAHATKGFHSIVLNLRSIGPTANILTDVLGYKFLEQEGNRHRFITDAVQEAAIVDLIESPKESAGKGGGGTNHHVAFRVANDEVLMQFRDKVLKKGLNITQKINRDYFYSLYFREPGGVLFELATNNPGFTVDEPLEQLGQNLKLPVQYESIRADIEKVLPAL